MKAISVHGVSGCQQCDRVFGKEVLTCPERRGGNCPFAKRNRNLSPMHVLSRLIGAAIFFVPLLFLISLLGLVSRTGVGEPDDLLCVPVALLLMTVGLVMMFYSNMELWDAKNKILWARKSLRGIELEQSVTVTVPDRDAPKLSPAPARLSYPGSYVAYYRYYSVKGFGLRNTFADFGGRSGTAVPLFQAAFADLLARELIQLQPCTQYVTSNRKQGEEQRHICLFVPGPRLTGEIRADELGSLERRILDVIRSGESEPCPEGLPIYHLVRAVFRTDKPNPWIWPISIVEKDMIGAGRGTRSFVNSLVLNPEVAVQLEEEEPKLLKLEEWIGKNPAFTEKLFLEGIRSAIKSRTAQEVDMH